MTLLICNVVGIAFSLVGTVFTFSSVPYFQTVFCFLCNLVDGIDTLGEIFWWVIGGNGMVEERSFVHFAVVRFNMLVLNYSCW